MIDLLKRVAADPGKYARVLPKIMLQTAAPLFSGRSFRLEGQMDIHPLSRWHDPSFAGRFGGFQLPDRPPRTIIDLEPWDSVRRDMLILLLRDVIERGIRGDIAELGVYKGHTAKLIHHYMPERVLHLFDTFATTGQKQLAASKVSGTTVDLVAQILLRGKPRPFCQSVAA